MFKHILLSSISLLFLATSSAGTQENSFSMPLKVEAVSFFGDTLYTPLLKEATFRGRQMRLMKAQRKLKKDPRNIDLLIWEARRLGYLNRFQEAIDVYSQGIATHPDLPHLYRHRGHRYISTRQLGKAIQDLEKARNLMEGMELEVEQDGLPNKENIPTTTLQFNVWYHLGLAYYLKGDFENAEGAYRSCLGVSANDDSKVSSSYWLYLTLSRLKRTSEAAAVLNTIPGEMALLETENYHELLLLFQGNRDVDAFLQKLALEDLTGATLAYGLSCALEHLGRLEEAGRLRERILTMDTWGAFGCIAAEADLYREKFSLSLIDDTELIQK